MLLLLLRRIIIVLFKTLFSLFVEVSENSSQALDLLEVLEVVWMMMMMMRVIGGGLIIREEVAGTVLEGGRHGNIVDVEGDIRGTS